MARDVWDSVDEESDTMKHWQSKFRRLRQHLQGWGGANKKEKKELLDTLDKLDKKAEGTILSPVEADL
jgi:hypothetical protein